MYRVAILPLLACAAVAANTAGWNPDALAEVERYAQSQKTTGFLIIDNHQVVLERNWPVTGDDRAAKNFTALFVYPEPYSHGALQEDVASAQKSFVAILAAVAIDKGLLDISKPVSAYLGPDWSKAGDRENAITVRHLMEMSSGLTEHGEFEAPAGTKFFYNTPVYAFMKPVLEKASGKSLDEITRTWLTDAVGMTETLWRKRPASMADVGNPTGLYTTPRDMAKLGQLVIDHGVSADGKRVVSEAQIKALFERSPTNPAYGHLWWLNGSYYTLRPAGLRSETPLIPAAPAELIAALGAQDRKIYLLPSRNIIVVRTGQAAPDRGFDQQIWLRLMKALPPLQDAK